jgi:hypothetical protein
MPAQATSGLGDAAPSSAATVPNTRYTTSIHTSVSACIKLSRHANAQQGRKVFRAQQTLDPKWFDARGGIELGFLSATLNKEIALGQSKGEQASGVLLEIDGGAMDFGARMESISQYPGRCFSPWGCCHELANQILCSKSGEDEVVFPPLSSFEVVGEPILQKHGHYRVTVVRVRVNANARNCTLDEMLYRRKQTVLNIGQDLLKEIQFDMKLISKENFSTTVLDNAMLKTKERDSGWFDFDENFTDELDTLLSKKQRTISKAVKTWEGEGKLKV